jgi:hypothetical protein
LRLAAFRAVRLCLTEVLFPPLRLRLEVPFGGAASRFFFIVGKAKPFRTEGGKAAEPKLGEIRKP